MKKPNIIVFDVDNTLVKGNLTFFFLSRLARENFFFFRKCTSMLMRGAILTLQTLPRLAQKTLSTDGNVYRLNADIYATVKQFYKKLFLTFMQLNLVGPDLEKKALILLNESFLQKRLYHEGIKKIAHHLCKPDTIVVLLSGSMQEVINSFYKLLCNKFTHENVDWKDRFFAIGTQHNVANGDIRPCIGSEKNLLLKEFLTKKGYDDYTLQFIYSDNNFMADLPLLIEAKNGGALVSKKNELYKLLPQKLVQSFVFLPYWKKRTIS